MHIEEEIGLELRAKLGEGSFGTVYECLNPRNGQTYAVKIFPKADFTKSKLQGFRKEAQILESIRHPNIVKFHSFQETDNCLYLLMEFVPGGTLKQLMRKRQDHGVGFTDEEVATVIRAILEGIKHLHKKGIIHRDLKPENILMVNAGDLSSIKIADFGLSAQVIPSFSNNVKSQCGTLFYMAPEIFFQHSYSKAVDIWSCAVIMYIMYTGKHPLYQEGMTTDEFKEKLNNTPFPPLNHPLAENFILRISQIQYADRYSVNEALNHPWITRNFDDQIPLSVSESIHSFKTAHLLSDTLKFVQVVGKNLNSQWAVPSQYLRVAKIFTQVHEEDRAHSPSYRHLRKNTKSAIMKLKTIFNEKQSFKYEKNESEYDEISSPLMRKHEKLFSRLVEQTKQEESPRKVIELQPIKEQKKWSAVQNFCSQKIHPQKFTLERPSSGISSELSSPAKKQKFQVNKYVSVFCSEKIQIEKNNKGIKKLGSLQEEKRTEPRNRSIMKKASFELREISSPTRLKKMTHRNAVDKTLEDPKASPNKPQTSDGKRTKKNIREIKPVVGSGNRGY